LVIYGVPGKKDGVIQKRELEVLEHNDERQKIVSRCRFRMERAVSNGGSAIKPINFMAQLMCGKCFIARQGNSEKCRGV
jgi:hypothetical protein